MKFGVIDLSEKLAEKALGAAPFGLPIRYKNRYKFPLQKPLQIICYNSMT